ncbi:N-acetylmuramic acid 6-phosphate etherase [Galbibacter sp. PAP.153]|uniref:N-acetylmuramic acid 6-phosphate etherase n=1 Tax=Galbibacter sp. PAP.153 TaxID=3104623 RepID=UPI00300BE85C
MNQQLTTENASHYNNLEKMSTQELLYNINTEDKMVPNAIEKALPKIEKLVDVVYEKMKNGGRLFYLGAGTSGRLGVLDASELPPTYGVSKELVIALIAGGDTALRNAVENEEDNTEKAWLDMQEHLISDKDAVIGIAASGTTPYVIGGVKKAKENNIVTGCITCNKNSPLAANVAYPVEVVVGPEFVTGSTRMKAGTAQKLILNMISTSLMIKMGKVKGNKMINMQLSNKKLVKRGVKMLMDELHIEKEEAQKLLMEHQSVKKAITFFKG